MTARSKTAAKPAAPAATEPATTSAAKPAVPAAARGAVKPGATAARRAAKPRPKPAAKRAKRATTTAELPAVAIAGRRATRPKSKPAAKAAKTARKRGAAAAAQLRPIGVIRSELATRAEAPKQGSEGAPDAWLDIHPWATDALYGLAAGDELLVITWFHAARRDVLQVHPRSDRNNPIAGVFATRSPDRPNPLGLHPVTLRAVDGRRLRIGPIEAIDGTPVVDIKPVL